MLATTADTSSTDRTSATAASRWSTFATNAVRASSQPGSPGWTIVPVGPGSSCAVAVSSVADVLASLVAAPVNQLAHVPHTPAAVRWIGATTLPIDGTAHIRDEHGHIQRLLDLQRRNPASAATVIIATKGRLGRARETVETPAAVSDPGM